MKTPRRMSTSCSTRVPAPRWASFWASASSPPSRYTSAHRLASGVTRRIRPPGCIVRAASRSSERAPSSDTCSITLSAYTWLIESGGNGHGPVASR